MVIRYSEAFIEQALFKVYSRGKRSVKSVAEELNVNCHTVTYWMRKRAVGAVGLPANKERRPKDWTPEQQLIALHQTHGLSGEALQTWCRENGLFAHHLSSWKTAFCAGAKAVDGSQEIRVLKDEVKQFKREIARKDHALAEAAALLILQKKFRALWEDEVK